MRQWRVGVMLVGAVMIGACSGWSLVPAADSHDAVARDYVQLVLALGEHDAAYVDAYFGPADWRTAVRENPPSLARIQGDAEALLKRLHLLAGAAPTGSVDGLRHDNLLGQLTALKARAEQLQGRSFSFDEEAQALYGTVVPHFEDAHFEALLEKLAPALPGAGPLADRFNAFRAQFVIPPDRLSAVFEAAIQECRQRTAEHLPLPPGERFTVEYVTDKPWSGYNWYQGDFVSLIQVNTDLPIYIDRAIDLACHEGYPGHHLYNALLEQKLLKQRGWIEHSVYALFSPQSLIAEGTANFGIDMAFTPAERLRFERDVLYPLAGLDPDQAETYQRIMKLQAGLDYAGNEAARRLLNGEFSDEQAAAYLQRYWLASPERAAQRVRFIHRYRSYVINYNLGRDLVAEAVNAAGPTASERWAHFQQLLSTPRQPANLTLQVDR